jgi:flagellar biosynthesis protein FlhF
LIDFAGSPLKDLEQIEKLKKLLPPDSLSCERHLVLSATLKDKDALELTERYRMVKPTDVVFNKLDEAVSHGLIYNYQKKVDLPLFTFGVGPALPEDFEFATKERLIDLIFKISKLKG